MRKPDWTWQQVHHSRPLDPVRVAGFIDHLAADASFGPLVFEARSTAGEISYLVGTKPRSASRIAATFCTALPGSRLMKVNGTRPQLRRALRITTSRPELALDTSAATTAIVPILSVLAATRADETLVLQLVLGNRTGPSTTDMQTPDYPNLLAALWSTPRKPSAQEAPLRRAKRATHGFAARIRVGAAAAGDGRTQALLRGLVGGLRTLDSTGSRVRAREENPARTMHAVSAGPTTMLSSAETVGLLGWPLGENELPGQPPLHPKQTGAPKRLARVRRPFAVTTGPGEDVTVGLGRDDSRQHALLIGPTGVGKSNAMAAMTLDAVEDGRDVLVIDPKGDLIENDILPRVPADRRDDVVVIDPTSDRPVGINPFANSARHPELVADSILAVFRTLYKDSWGPRLEDVLYSALLTLARTPGATLTMLPALLTDPATRRRLTANLRDPVGLEPFWRSYEAMSPEQQAQVIAPVLNKLRPYLLRTTLRRTLGQADPAFDLSQLFTERRIILVKLNKGVLGQGSRLLGALIVSQLWPLVLARAAVPQAKRHTVNVVIDEVQDYLALPGDLGDSFAQARGLGVGLIVGHQFRKPLPPQLLAGLDANARSVIAFGLDVADASEMARRAPGLAADDFMALPKHHIYARLQDEGESTGWFSARTLALGPATTDAHSVIRQSAERWGRDTAAIDREIERAIGLAEDVEQPGPAVGRKKRETAS